jgi:hypothetical protein
VTTHYELRRHMAQKCQWLVATAELLLVLVVFVAITQHLTVVLRAEANMVVGDGSGSGSVLVLCNF